MRIVAAGGTGQLGRVLARDLRALKSRFVVPTRLLQAGFRSDFPRWGEAATDLVARWRAS